MGKKRHSAEQIVRKLREAEVELAMGARPVDSAGGSGGKLLSPARCREAVLRVRRELGVSERRACRVLKQPRTTQRYVPKPVGAKYPGFCADSKGV